MADVSSGDSPERATHPSRPEKSSRGHPSPGSGWLIWVGMRSEDLTNPKGIPDRRSFIVKVLPETKCYSFFGIGNPELLWNVGIPISTRGITGTG